MPYKYNSEGYFSANSVHEAFLERHGGIAKQKNGDWVGRDFFGSVEIERAGPACARPFHDMQVDHGGGDIGMTQEALDGPDVGFRLEEMGGEGMAHGMAGGTFKEALRAAFRTLWAVSPKEPLHVLKS